MVDSWGGGVGGRRRLRDVVRGWPPYYTRRRIFSRMASFRDVRPPRFALSSSCSNSDGRATRPLIRRVKSWNPYPLAAACGSSPSLWIVVHQPRIFWSTILLAKV